MPCDGAGIGDKRCRMGQVRGPCAEKGRYALEMSSVIHASKGRCGRGEAVMFTRGLQQGLLAHFVGPDRESIQPAGAEGGQERHVGGVVAIRHQHPADARRVVARIEGVPAPAQVRLQPIYQTIRHRQSN